jgi:uncharacterized protein YbbC (DUF1343 family)
LHTQPLRGVRLLPASFTPAAPAPFADQLCHGIRIVVTDRNSLDTPGLGIEIAWALNKLYGKEFQLAKIDRLLVNGEVLAALQSGSDPQTIARAWRSSLYAFQTSRQTYLLY